MNLNRRFHHADQSTCELSSPCHRPAFARASAGPTASAPRQSRCHRTGRPVAQLDHAFLDALGLMSPIAAAATPTQFVATKARSTNAAIGEKPYAQKRDATIGERENLAPKP